MGTREVTSFISDELPENQGQRYILSFWPSFNRQDGPDINQPEEEEDGSAVADSIHVVIVIHVGFDGINEAGVKLVSLVKDEESLRAAQHHVPDRLSQLALETERKPKTQRLSRIWVEHDFPFKGK